MDLLVDNRKVFIDTNILIYASLKESPFHQASKKCLGNLQKQEAVLVISRQVLREYLAAMTRPNTITMELQQEKIIQAIRAFEEDFVVLNEGAEVTKKLLELTEKVSVSGKQIHDANIAATMLVNGITELLTHNVGDFKRFTPDLIIIPLVKKH